MRLHLPTATHDLAATAAAFHDAMVRDLFGGDGPPFKGLSVHEDGDGASGAPAWTDPSGEILLDPSTAAALAPGAVEAWAVEALAHQLFHGVGEGPAFPFQTDALLEEALAETLMQAHRDAFLEAFGVTNAPAPAVAFAVACDRLRTIASGHPVTLAIDLKPLPPDDRAAVIAALAVPPAPFGGDQRVADAEAVTLLSSTALGAIAAALEQAERHGVGAAVRRSLDYGLHVGWARRLDAVKQTAAP